MSFLLRTKDLLNKLLITLKFVEGRKCVLFVKEQWNNPLFVHVVYSSHSSVSSRREAKKWDKIGLMNSLCDWQRHKTFWCLIIFIPKHIHIHWLHCDESFLIFFRIIHSVRFSFYIFHCDHVATTKSLKKIPWGYSLFPNVIQSNVNQRWN